MLDSAPPDLLIDWMRERRSSAATATRRSRRADRAPARRRPFRASAHNRQPWRFAVLDDAGKTRLATAMGERLHADRTADCDAPDDIARDVERSRARIVGAPAVIAACYSLADMDRYPDARRADAERLMAVQSTAMAVQKLSSCWPMPEGLALLNMHAAVLPGHSSSGSRSASRLAARRMITLGYPQARTAAPPPRPRRDRAR